MEMLYNAKAIKQYITIICEKYLILGLIAFSLFIEYDRALGR